MTEKPYVFIGSSTEQLSKAYLVQERLQLVAYSTVWTQGVFEPSKSILDSLLSELRRCDFGIFVFTADDLLKIRDRNLQTVRDNVLFELGLFIGHLGRERCFIILPRGKDIHLPSDLHGFTPVFYDETHPKLNAAIGGACTKIEGAINKLGKKSFELGDLERKIREVSPKNEANLSTGAAVKYIGENVIEAIINKDIIGIDDLAIYSRKLAESIRGQMLEFRHFVKVGREYPLSTWFQKNEYLAEYIKEYLAYIEKCNMEIGQAFGQLLIGKTNICLTEYSRAVLSGILYRLKTGDPLNIYLVDRSAKATVPEEIQEIEKTLINAGASIKEKMNLEEWLEFLKSIIKEDLTSMDYIVFGAEAVTHRGDNVFPQIIPDSELEQLYKLRKVSSRNTKIVCVAESYKVLTYGVFDSVSNLPNKGNYTIIRSNIYDMIVTEKRVIDGFKESGLLASSVEAIETSRQICLGLLRKEKLVPFDYMPNGILKNIKVLASDIDDTITMGGKIPPEIVESFTRLQKSGISVVLITGRSSGWCQSIINYIAGIDCIIAENGIVLIDGEGRYCFLNGEDSRSQLDEDVISAANRLKDKYNLEYTQDSQFRLKEITFVRPKFFGERELMGLKSDMPDSIDAIASSIHIHIRKKGSDKGKALDRINSQMFRVDQNRILVIGDSATDKSLFGNFSNSVGVANILKYVDELGELTPKFITKKPEGKGFLEVVERLISCST